MSKPYTHQALADLPLDFLNHSHHDSIDRDSISSIPNDREDCPIPTPPGDVAVPSGRRSRARSSTTAAAIKCDVMVQYLRQQQLKRLWSDGSPGEGVVLRRARNDFICQPINLAITAASFYNEIQSLNVKAAMTVKTNVIITFLQDYNLSSVPMKNGLQLQVLPDMAALSRCKKHHYAAFIKDQASLIVWDDDASNVISRAEKIEQYLVDMLWAMDDSNSTMDLDLNEKITYLKSANTSVREFGKSDDEVGIAESQREAPRSMMLYQAILVALSSILLMFAMGLGWKRLAMEVKYDKNWTRLALLAVTPWQIWAGLFFFQSLVNGIAQIIGPVKQCRGNSTSFTGTPVKRIIGPLPHVTVQCPVYKEGLMSVIHPTVVSLKKAISTYEMQGGSANIFINDDGMQVIPEDEAQARRLYYEDNNIGWVARPKHAPKGDENGANVFVRAGKFKKASNMNYALRVSTRIEEIISQTSHDASNWSQDEEDQLYVQALSQVLEEDQDRTWAEGNVRIGDYILIVDSDTRVPEDCFLDAVSEMEQAPRVAIVQFSSGVMNVTTSFFEQGITFFTNFIYTAIRFAVANGDVAPFVGHNAIMRWTAVQHVSYELDGVEKFWAENTVSEDFDMALRLQSLGYTIRFNTIFGDGFQEGVSLTVYDELARWEKYAYGCSELVFHPFKYWLFRGPFTPLFRRFIGSNMSLMAKITIMGYIGTYFAIAASWALTVMNYFIVGWFNGFLDEYYLDSFKVYVSLIAIFSVLGNVALAVFRYRTEDRNMFSALLENFKWLFLLTCLFGGLSMHLSQALLSHLLGFDMSWGATSKEATTTSFFQEVPTILKKFKFTFTFAIIMTAAMIALAGVGPVGQLIPYSWQIKTFTSIYPVAILIALHFLMPLVLNPGLMQFTF